MRNTGTNIPGISDDFSILQVLIPGCLGALMNFSYPDLDSEHALVDVARQLAELCKERLPECRATRLKISRA